MKILQNRRGAAIQLIFESVASAGYIRKIQIQGFLGFETKEPKLKMTGL